MTPIYTIEIVGTITEPRVRLTIHATGEVREAREIEAILRTLVRDHGFYLRPVKE